jgi:NADH dehydrogenase
MRKNIVIIGSGFAGMWAALSAARLIRIQGSDKITVTVLSPKAELRVRPRFYESKVKTLVSPLMPIFKLMDIQFISAKVVAICTEVQTVNYIDEKGVETVKSYDKLVLASGSSLNKSLAVGVDEFAFDIDQLDSASILEEHLNTLPSKPYSVARNTVVVCGGGFTGIELATELPSRLRSQFSDDRPIHIIVVERGGQIGSNYSEELQAVIKQASDELGITWMLNADISEISADGVLLSNGELIESETVIWTAGVQANTLTSLLSSNKGPHGRLLVDPLLQVKGINNVYATGDVAYVASDDKGNYALMSCQHAILMGKFAGNNVAASVLNVEPLPYRQENYVTCLDLGSWGAVFTEGWEQKVKLVREKAKEVKISITNELIYPPKADLVTVMENADPLAAFV